MNRPAHYAARAGAAITRHYVIAGLALVGLIVGLVACDAENNGRESDERTAERQLEQFQQAQPVPRFNYSQLRQNLIEIETAQADATATTSFMFLLSGAGATGPLVHWCPSIGFPIPATYQLTNPEQVVTSHGAVISQIEANGVYTGDTTGTYVICVGDDGKAFAFYHEGYVSTVTGPAHWDTAAGEIVMDGTSSAEFTEGEAD